MSWYALYGLVFYLLITLQGYIGGGQLSVIILSWCISPVPFLALALWFEHGPRALGGRGQSAWEIFKNVFSLHTQAWSFVIGDIVLLPWAFAIATDRLNHHGVTLADVPWWWLVVSAAVGIITGIGFHYMDIRAYAKEGYAESISSPTKLFHDFVAFPLLFGGLLFILGVLFHREQLNSSLIGIFVLLAAWFALGVADTWRINQRQRRNKQQPPWSHPPFDLKNGVVLFK